MTKVLKTAALEPSPELLSACQNGDREAFREIFQRYRTYAYNLIYKIIGSNVDHEDLVQEVFFQMHLSLSGFKGDSSFSTWFHRLVIHVCSGHLRYIKAGKRIPQSELVAYDTVSDSNRRQGGMSAYEARELIEKAMAKLDERLRVPLVLSVYSEMGPGEISDVIGISEGTVKSRLFAARQKIKEYIGDF
ncbi:MAG: RNA polymerase sigma factor [Chitinispirillaceae bacterium]|nr:RNA polymerase sigma factor [Chitinispirillaceae bacterium]